MLVFQAPIFLVIFFITKKKDILFYSIFLFSIAAYFFINAPNTFFGIDDENFWNSKLYNYFNIPSIIIANFFYLLFHNAFFYDLTKNPLIKRVFKIALLMMVILLLLFVIITIYKINHQAVYFSVKLATVIPPSIVCYIILKKKLPFARLIATGLLSVVVGTCITGWMDYQFANNTGTNIFSKGYPFFFLKAGILCEMICYVSARLKKWNYQEKQIAIEKIQSQLAVEKLRNKISGELHDDIGSTLSGIAMYSHMADDLLQKQDFSNSQRAIETIQKSTHEIVGKLGDLVWSINPEKDTTAYMFERIENYGSEICAAKGIKCYCNFDQIEKIDSIQMEARRNIYLILKEAINNVVKYSNASELKLNASLTNNELKIIIDDNGDGFDISTIKKGNGLENMAKRAAEMQAVLEINTNPGNGCLISLIHKIPHRVIV